MLAAAGLGVEQTGFVEALWRVVTLQAGYNTTIVVLGATLLGIAAGAVGCFAMLRRQALMSDAMAHATLPGVALGALASEVAWDAVLGSFERDGG